MNLRSDGDPDVITDITVDNINNYCIIVEIIIYVTI